MAAIAIWFNQQQTKCGVLILFLTYIYDFLIKEKVQMSTNLTIFRDLQNLEIVSFTVS